MANKTMQSMTMLRGIRSSSGFPTIGRLGSQAGRWSGERLNARCSIPKPNIAQFRTSARQNLLPPLPQRIDGTTNDPAPIPEPSPTHGSYHWGFERAVSVALVPLTIAPFAAGSLNPVMDAVFCGTILIHSHIGFQSIIIDYLPKKRVPKTRALFWWGLNAGTILVAVGLYEFETNDVGVTEAVKRIWNA